MIETALGNRGYGPRHMALAVIVVMLSSVDVAGQPVSIATAHGSPGEDATRAQLTRLLDAYDLGKWLFTRSVVIDERAIPHSHPVLTLHTRHSDDLQLLSTFVHEQLHWHIVAKDDQVQSAIGDIVDVFEFWTTDHYTWIYETVLSDEATLGDVVAEHGLDVD